MQGLLIVVLPKDGPDGVKKDGHFNFPGEGKIWHLQAGNSNFGPILACDSSRKQHIRKLDSAPEFKSHFAPFEPKINIVSDHTKKFQFDV